MDYSRLRISLILLLAIIFAGTTGYSVFEDMPVFDAFYMTVITVSTVGFSEIKPLSQVGRIMTVIIIVSGISVLTYTLGQVARIFVEGELSRILGRRKLEKQISKLNDHYIICGFGRIGTVISRELFDEKISFVVIEQDSEKIKQLEEDHFLYLNMDATSEEALLQGGIHKARGIVTAVRSDADNVFVTLTARGLRPDIFVLARASDMKNESKMLKAGASRVVCPYLLGGRRMAQILKKPTVVDFIDTAMMDSKLGLKMEEAVVGPASDLIGKTLIDSQIRPRFGVVIVAIKKPTNEMVFNPTSTEKLESGDTIVVIGKKEDLKRMNEVLG
ncbi:MAG: potassium channel protein [Candidatus Desulfatibia sp.]|jgi:voltage-gated potassium channel|uniref:potassium channel family protein n=1 Tax=Candidatus Desulfatibia sp. TaxID=3101189 RepID=UPI002F3272F7